MASARRTAFRRHLAASALLLLAQLALAPWEGAGGAGVWPAGPRVRAARAQSAPDYEEEPQSLYELGPLGWLVARIEPYFPTVNLNYSLVSGHRFEHGQLDVEVEAYFEQRLPANATVDELQLLAVKAALRVAPMPIHTSWGYESREELRLSSLPVRDEARCGSQLGQLRHRLDRLLGPEGAAGELAAAAAAAGAPLAAHEASPVENLEARQLYQSRDLPLARYLDSFGRVPSDALRGNVKWYGSHSGCLDSRLGGPADPRHQPAGQRLRFRYCMVALKSSAWGRGQPSAGRPQLARNAYGVHTRDLQADNFFLRVGVCLPEACDSSALDYQQNVQNIEKLVKFNLMKPFNSDRYYLADLYCLPDGRSPLRSIPAAGKLLLAAAALWLLAVGVATSVHLNVERFYVKTVRLMRASGAAGEPRGSKQSLNSNNNNSNNNKKHSDPAGNNQFRELDLLGLKHNWLRLNVYLYDRSSSLLAGVDLVGCLSLYSNWLRYTHRLKVAVAGLHQHEQRLARVQRRNRKRPAGPEAGAPAADEPGAEADELALVEAEANKRRVDTSSLDALKVMALFWIIAGHCVFFLGSAVANPEMIKSVSRDVAAFALANGAMYITELFFVITGCLTAYLAFKHNSFRLEGPTAAAAAARGSQAAKEAPEHEAGDPRAAQERPTGAASPLPVYLESRMFRLPFWAMVCLNRYLRIAPSYLLVYSLVRLVSLYAGGSGQLWDYAVGANSMRRQCARESWLPVLSLTTNMVEVYDHCIVGGWYLSADFQLMVMSVPLLMWLARCQRRQLHRKRQPPASALGKLQQQQPQPQQQQQQQQQLPEALGAPGEPANVTNGAATQLEIMGAERGAARPEAGQDSWPARNQVRVSRRRLLAGYSLVLALAAASALASIGYGLHQSEVDLSYVVKLVPHAVAILSRNIAMYTNSLFRFRAFALGLLLGHALYLYEWGLVALPGPVQRHGSKLAAGVFGLFVAVMFMPVLYPKGKIVLSHDLTVVLMIACATGIDLFLCLLIFLACVGKAPKAALFLLNSPFWSLLSSLSLAAFLVHAEVIVLLTSQLNPLPSVQYSLLLFVFSATLVLTYSLALALYLAFELPVSRLIESLLRHHCAGSPLAASDRARRC